MGQRAFPKPEPPGVFSSPKIYFCTLMAVPCKTEGLWICWPRGDPQCCCPTGTLVQIPVGSVDASNPSALPNVGRGLWAQPGVGKGSEATPPFHSAALVGLGNVSAFSSANVTMTHEPAISLHLLQTSCPAPSIFLISTVSSLNSSFPCWEQKHLSMIQSDLPWVHNCICKMLSWLCRSLSFLHISPSPRDVCPTVLC